MSTTTLNTAAITRERSGGLLARRLGKRPVDWTLDDLLDLVENDGIRNLSLMHVGGDGWLKALDFTPLSREHVDAVLRGGERADGSSLFVDGGIRAGASDIVLRPRLETAFLDPFATEPTLAILCHHLDREGNPLDVSPDTIVHRAFDRMHEELDVELFALGEVEYFLGRPTQANDIYGSDDRGYHAASPFVFGADLRRRAMATLADMGVPVKYGHSEVGWVETDHRTWEQHEIELALAPLPMAADAVVLTQWVLRNLAAREGMLCSFDPVVRAGHAGSGMHFHFSPMRDGEHLAAAAAAENLGYEARCLIGGLVTAGGALMAFGNRQDASFVRLSQGKETPETITWGRYNRHALVRLPIRATSEDGGVVTPPTIEFRLPDGSVHPHLLLASVAQSMVAARDLPDLRERVARTEAGQESGEMTALPVDRKEIAEQLRGRREWLERGGIFPPHLVDATLRSFDSEA